MEALLCKRLGDPTSSSEPPTVKIKIKATSLTFATYLKILGKYQEKHPLPFIPGSDYAGTVDAVGPSATKSSCCLWGSAFSPCMPPIFYFLSLNSVRKVLLVLGAAGGVGLAAVQIGKICGAVVIAVARGDEKVQLLKSLGVDHVVDLMNQYVTASIKEFLKSRNLKGVDVLYDPVGGNLAKETRKLLNWGAQILVIGFASGEIPVIPANIILVKNWIVHGFYWGSYRIHQPAVLEDSVRELISWMEKGLITVHISHTYSLSKRKYEIDVLNPNADTIRVALLKAGLTNA
ncbi:hypothetical protein GOBAR_AA17848 [Gossypium barbadense]|uniref:Enoyl reductase (ER) domain-containing protein n=1 Tax=Gossypium barbadense TaxID=3634 RepID=A0A2P5XHG1_GOSBA|nr:hypothetical protein GOBAR_AA17848 [Gossypium barbadense]